MHLIKKSFKFRRKMKICTFCNWHTFACYITVSAVVAGEHVRTLFSCFFIIGITHAFHAITFCQDPDGELAVGTRGRQEFQMEYVVRGG